MRFLPLIATLVLFASCVKRPSREPVPKVEFIEIIGPSQTPRGDTCTVVLGYEDGDGDLFTDNNTQGPTVLLTPYYFNEESGTFEGYFMAELNDTLRIPYSIRQPDNGYYKGKSIKGQLFIPLKEFRKDNTIKVFKIRGYLQDTRGNRSEMFSSPGQTVNF